MINHTTVLAHTGNTDSQMLCWTDKIHSADRQSCENYQQPRAYIYILYIIVKVVVAPVNTPSVGVDIFSNFLKESK